MSWPDARPSPPAVDAAPEMAALDTDLIGDLGARTATLLLHGAEGDKTQLRPLAESLAPALAILPSLRGHGSSPMPTSGFSPLDLSADLHRMAHRWPAELHLVGYSFGAVVAAVSAVTWAATRTRSLVVLDTGFGAYPELHENDEWAEGSWLRWTYDWRPVLAAVTVPVLVVRSEHSRLLNDETVGELERMPHVSVIEAAGDHDSVLDDPTLLTRLMQEWRR